MVSDAAAELTLVLGGVMPNSGSADRRRKVVAAGSGRFRYLFANLETGLPEQ
jgi:hypothetical protein